MRLLIAGSRSITDFDPERLIPKETEFIICGGAGGGLTVLRNEPEKR
ncbi:MAG: hypothetical protein IJC19_01385 [Clostridia bacterium]|nr:hypothetical protein [Clostridia bacterium]